MSKPIRSLRIEVSPWPNAEIPDPVDMWQWDIYANDEWVAGGTGPDGGDPYRCASFALDGEWTYED